MSSRAAQVRFYVDADVLGLGKILAGLRNNVTYPGDPGAVIHRRQRPPCPITSPDVLDTDWIPQVAARSWLIITRDAMISQNRNEITAVRALLPRLLTRAGLAAVAVAAASAVLTRPNGRRSIWRAALPVSATPSAGQRLALDLIVAIVTL